MQDPNNWKFPTNPHSRHPSAEHTRQAAREEKVAREIERWRTSAQRTLPERRRNRRVLGVLRGLFLLLMTLGVLGAAGVWLAGNAMQDRIYPQVVAGDVSVGSLTAAQAREKLEERVARFLDAPVTLQLNTSTWSPLPEDLGVSVNLDETVRQARLAGRQGSPVIALWNTLLGNPRPVTVPLVMEVDRARMSQYLDEIGQAVNRDPVNPTVSVEGGTVRVVSGEPGYRFLKEETEAELLERLASLSSQPVSVQVLTSEGPISPEEIRRAQGTAARIVAGPIVLETAGQRSEITQSQLQSWLRSEVRQTGPKGSGGRSTVEVYLDPSQVATFVRQTAREVDRPVKNVRLQWVGGQVQVTEPSQTGRAVDIRRTVAAIQRAAVSGSRTVRLPVRTTRPSVSEADIRTLGIQGLIAVGESSFTGSPPERVENIRKAAAAVTGYVVPPAGLFSFNEVVGSVTEEAGYKPELVGDNQRATQGPATGISQVSTTVYRAAFTAGLAIEERRSAPYRVVYYEQGHPEGTRPPGMDAVVQQPGDDLRFVNTTSATILVQVLVGDGEMRVELYGTSPGWKVEISRPEFLNRTQPGPPVYWRDPENEAAEPRLYLPASPGVEVTIRRRVLQGIDVIDQAGFSSTYAPLPNVFVR